MSIAVLEWLDLDEDRRAAALRRPAQSTADLAQRVAEIIATVRRDGNAALRALGLELDGVEPDSLAVPEADLQGADAHCDPELLKAMDRALSRIEAFHRAGMPQNVRLETAPGLLCEARYLPVSPVGLYVPGGSAPLVSTVLMLAAPARLAGCPEVVLCTPPGQSGAVHPAVLAAARRCGVRRIFAVSGAQAIAAMAYGTESIPRCAKVFGPGNTWVTEAKRQVSNDPDGASQDMPAGPSEVMVIADDAADPQAVSWDLLSQAEHGPDSQAILISDSRALLDAVADALPGLAAGLPRAEVLQQSLQSLRLIRVAGPEEAIAIAERYAPEHLILNCADAEVLCGQVSRAGSVFIGPWTPESLGDYSSGTNHVLPTYGHARSYSGLSVTDFMRRMTVQTASREGLREAGADAMALAAVEGLDAHRMAVEYRLGGS